MDTIEKYLPAFKKQLDKLVVFEDEEWDIFKRHLHLKILHKKDFFVTQGEVCKDVGFIVSGSVRFFHVRDGAEITNYFCLDNEFVSSYKSFLKQQPSFTNIQVLEDTVLLTFSHKSVQQLVDNKITAYKMERFGRLIAEYLICCYEDRVQAFVTQTPEERYIDLLESNSRILQRIPQHYLANFLGITPVSLSRIRKRIFETVK
ncbi:Crp/Fnr family transcriptional regulator [Mucilaginibacter sp. PAMB04274]|uniref:Crp/Fnr family transcriptional regulator n=1 Tax=Mucilaginibacter sp. PAMB04274 TaxID=3138568 RepID=UPI0031F6E41D